MIRKEFSASKFFLWKNTGHTHRTGPFIGSYVYKHSQTYVHHKRPYTCLNKRDKADPVCTSVQCTLFCYYICCLQFTTLKIFLLSQHSRFKNMEKYNDHPKILLNVHRVFIGLHKDSKRERTMTTTCLKRAFVSHSALKWNDMLLFIYD